MSDNVSINPGTGVAIATDDVAGVQYQRVKLSDGTPDSANHAKVDAAGSLQVKDAGVNSAASFFALACTTTPQACNTGANLANRVFIHLQNRGANDIEVNTTSTWTLGQGTIIPSGQTAGFTFGPGLTVYARTVSGTSDLRVIEMA